MQPIFQYGWFLVAALLAAAGIALQGEEPAWASLVAGLGAALIGCAGFVVRNARQGILATAALCFACNGYLFSRKLEGASGPSICNVNDVLNCDLVNTSAASELFGLPVTLYGMGLFLGIGFAALYDAKKEPRLGQVTAWFAAAATLFNGYLAYQSSVIGAVCLVCMTIYAGTLLMLWAGVKETRAAEIGLTSDLGSVPTSTSSVTIVGTFVIVVLVGSNTWSSKGSGRPDPKQIAPEDLGTLYANPFGPIELDGTEPVYGDPGAPYLVVEWADFGCPHCALAARELKDLEHDLPGLVQIRFRTFPLTASCNPGLEEDHAPERCQAAAAAECARLQGKFWELSELLFANQGYFQPNPLAAMAEQAGVQLEPWSKCMADPAVMQTIIADAIAGANAGIRGTPAMFLRGTHGDRYVEVFGGATAIYRLIEAHRAGKPLPPPGPPRAP